MSHPAGISVSRYPESIAAPLLPDSASLVAAALDGLAILIAGGLANLLYWALTGGAADPILWLSVSLLLAGAFMFLMRSWALYDTRNLLALDRQIKWAGAAWLASLGFVLGVAFLLKSSADLSRGEILLFAGLGIVALAGHRLSWPNIFGHALDRGLIRRRRALVLSLRPWAEAGLQMRVLRRAGIEVVARHVLCGDADRERGVSRVLASARRLAPDEIILLTSCEEMNALGGIMADLRPLPLPVRLLPDASLSTIALQPSHRLGTCALVDLSREPLSPGELARKRALDIMVAGTALLLASPLLLFAMLAIKLDSPGPVLFRQSRRGFNGRTFRILKFRSMKVLEDGPTIVQAVKADPRVTRVGAWLRRTSVDELPQLWNVLRGEMSVVGPRPHAVAHDDHYHRVIQNYASRHHVKPGITGWAQVNGYRGETPDVADMAARVEHDLWYVNNWTLFLDLRILFFTALRLFTPKAY